MSDVTNSRKDQLLALIRANPFVSQQELAERSGLSRSAVAGHVASLVREGRLLGRAYVLPQAAPLLCMGGANIDRKLQTLARAHLRSSNPARQSETPGGVARNIAENLARLGLPVRLHTALGEDAAGRVLQQHAEALGISLQGSLLHQQQHPTGSYTAVLDADGELLVALAQMELIDALDPAWLARSAAQRSEATLWVADLNLRADTLAALCDEALHRERPLLLVAVSVRKMDRLPAELRGVRCLIANEDELAAAAGLASARHAQTRREAWQRLRARGLQQLVVTAGARGAYFSRGATLQHLPALPVQVREVSGAGDAFAAGVCAALHRDADDLHSACRLGLQLAALTLQTEASVSPALSPALLVTDKEENPR